MTENDMKNRLTLRQCIDNDDFVKNKRTYILEFNDKKVQFKFGNNWGSDLFVKLCKFKIKRHFNL